MFERSLPHLPRFGKAMGLPAPLEQEFHVFFCTTPLLSERSASETRTNELLVADG
jgi:hypothetical protein